MFTPLIFKVYPCIRDIEMRHISIVIEIFVKLIMFNR